MKVEFFAVRRIYGPLQNSCRGSGRGQIPLGFAGLLVGGPVAAVAHAFRRDDRRRAEGLWQSLLR